MAKVAYVDVDDTLVRSAGTKRIPIVAVVRQVRELKEEGWELYCWSSGGGEYAKASAEELGISSCFVGFLPKPDVMIDDVSPQSWSFLRVIHPSEIHVLGPRSRRSDGVVPDSPGTPPAGQLPS